MANLLLELTGASATFEAWSDQSGNFDEPSLIAAIDDVIAVDHVAATYVEPNNGFEVATATFRTVFANPSGTLPIGGLRIDLAVFPNFSGIAVNVEASVFDGGDELLYYKFWSNIGNDAWILLSHEWSGAIGSPADLSVFRPEIVITVGDPQDLDQNIRISAVNLSRIGEGGGGSQSAGASHFMQLCGM